MSSRTIVPVSEDPIVTPPAVAAWPIPAAPCRRARSRRSYTTPRDTIWLAGIRALRPQALGRSPWPFRARRGAVIAVGELGNAVFRARPPAHL